jgi:RimJ/RimL family protein N-acetyltransferase
MVRIPTERLTLRDFMAADEAAVHSYASDPVVTRFLIWGPNTVEDTRTFIADAMAAAQLRPRRSFDLAVVETGTQALIGGAALRLSEDDLSDGEIGYALHRGHWSRGYGTEAAKGLLQFGFRELGLRRIMATCDPDNPASARVLQKAGLQYERRISNHLLVRGCWRDSLLFVCSSTA